MHQISAKIDSKIMKLKMPVLILIPEESPEDCPVIWLLHGGSESGEDLLDHCNLSRYADHLKNQAVLVLPDGLNSDFANHPEFGTGYRFADFFFDELMPFIQNTTCASASPEKNSIAGYSMGGAASLMLGLAHPERFSLIAPLGASVRESDFLEGDIDLSGSAFRLRASLDRTKYPTEYGDPAEGITEKEINMIAKYPTVKDYVDSMECTGKRFIETDFDHMPPIWFCCGEQDPCCSPVTDFVTFANSMGAGQVSCQILPGLDHSAEKECVQAFLDHVLDA